MKKGIVTSMEVLVAEVIVLDSAQIAGKIHLRQVVAVQLLCARGWEK